MKFDTAQNMPVNTLMIAINQYISTGDNIGEGVAMPDGDNLLINIAVNRNDPTDQEDFKKFQARVNEIKEPPLTLVKDPWSRPPFDMWVLTLKNRDVSAFTKALQENPGPLGWGSCKPLADIALAEIRKRS